MKQKIQQAFEHQTPDVLSSVLSACENEKGEIVVKEEKWQFATPRKPRKSPWLGIAAMAAAVALIVGVGFAVWSGREQVESTEQMQMQYDNGTESVPTTEPTELTEPTETTEPTEPQTEWDIPSLVAKYNIAPAKAELLLGAMENHPEYTIEELLEVDRETLFWHSMSFNVEDYPVDSLEARNIAKEHAGVPEVWNYTAEINRGVYEINFCYEKLSYRYRVDAESGEVLVCDPSDNPDASDQMAAVEATLAFFEDFTPVTFLGEDRDLTPHLVDADAEIWANALYFLPKATARCYDDEFWLTNQRDYILQYAEYWRDVRKDTVYETLQIDYSVSHVNVFGDFAQVYLYENKSMRYEGLNADSGLSDDYEIMLINEDGTWKVFDLTSSNGGESLKYPDGYPQPPLVTEAYSASYVGRGQTTWYQSMPQVMLNSEYAQQINERYYERANSMRTWEHTENAEGVAYEYEWYVHGDLLTIVVKNTHTGFEPAVTYTIYTLRISDGAQATREDILAYAGVEEEELIERAHPLIAHTFGTSFGGEMLHEMVEYLPSNEANSGSAFLQYTFGRSVSRENIQEANLYLDKDGTLCFQAKIYQIAGADYHEREYRIDDPVEKSPLYETLMTYGIGWEIPINNGYPFEEVFLKAFETAGVTESEVTDIQGFVTYYVTRDSYYRICFNVQGVPHTYYFTVGTCEQLDKNDLN